MAGSRPRATNPTAPDCPGTFLPVRRFANYLIFYRVTAAPRRLHIIRILHGARDVPQVMG